MTQAVFITESLKVGSALLAAELVHAGKVDVAFSYGGGLHHAGPAMASGFCVFNLRSQLYPTQRFAKLPDGLR